MQHSHTTVDAFWNTRDGNMSVVPTKEGRLWMFRRGNLSDSIWYFYGDEDSQTELPTSGSALDGARFIHTCIRIGLTMCLKGDLYVPIVPLYDTSGFREWLAIHRIEKVPNKEELKVIIPQPHKTFPPS